MDKVLAVAQVVGTLFIAGTFVIYYFQLKAMRAASQAQNILSLASFLQAPDTREARRQMLSRLKETPYAQ